MNSGPSKTAQEQNLIRNRTRNNMGQKVALTQYNINKTVVCLKGRVSREHLD
jgi:hypothetical protein